MVYTVLRSVDPSFTTGWLFDDVIDAYLWCLKHGHPGKYVQLIASPVMLVLQNGLSSDRVWRGEDLSRVDWMFAPWNPTGNHWTLVAVNIMDKTILYVNPSETIDVDKSLFVGMLKDFLVPFLSRYGWEGFSITSPSHSLQKDSTGCGVLTCWYAQQLLLGRQLTDPVNTKQMRFDIYQALRGNCLQRLCNSEKKLSKCPICSSITDSSAMVSCTKCKQWYHCHCLGITADQAKEKQILHGPP